MDSHPHTADIDCLVRQGNVHNILMLNNPTTAHTCLGALRVALKMGQMDKLPSFFFDLECPSVKEYRAKQATVADWSIYDSLRGSEVSQRHPSRSRSRSSISSKLARNSMAKSTATRASMDKGAFHEDSRRTTLAKGKDKKKMTKKGGLFRWTRQ